MNKRNIKNDYILIVAAILLLILSGGVIFWSPVVKNNNSASQVLPSKIIGQAELTIDFGNNRKRIFEGDIINNETLINALIQASKAGNFSYKLDDKNNLAAIENYAGDQNKFWQWYLNDKKVNKLPSEIILKSGDKILIKYD